jgi:single-stranded-DNA-specific exonuclease
MSVMVGRSRRWHLCGYDRQAALRLAHTLGLFETTAGLLVRRGINTPELAEKFLYPSITDLHSPMLMRDMDAAVARVLRAIGLGEKILIYGDYDVDGTTATVILKKALEVLGASVGYFIPQRLIDGNGMREAVIDQALSEGYRLIISVDCGIRAHAVVEHARNSGIDVVITDHHLPEGELPSAVAVLNPKRPDCNYLEKNLAGCGVAFKLAQALLAESNRSDQLEALLKIAAIGTIADIVPLVGENRIIAKCGLAGLSRPDNFGLRALLEVAGVYGRAVNCYDIGFRIAPRINAVGRMGGASAAVELFSAQDMQTAMRFAQEMNEQNFARQRTEADIIEDIMSQLEGDSSLAADRVIVLAGERWHRGVIGIAASKVVEKMHRPALVISIEEGIGYGSGRSIKEFPLLEALDSCSELFERYGGHSHAAGVTIRSERIEELRSRLNQFAALAISEEDLVQVLEIDAELSFAEINLDLMRELSCLEPFGAGNPSPTFLAQDVRIKEGPQILRERHLKYYLAHRGHTLDAVWWGAFLHGESCPADFPLSLIFSLGEPIYSDPSHIQIAIKDMQSSGRGIRE